MVQFILLPIPMALAWVALTDQPSLEGFAIGYVLAFGLAFVLTKNRPLAFNLATVPRQILSTVIYVVTLAWDVFRSGIDVALRAAGIRPICPGIIAVPIQHDDVEGELLREVIAGLSAHAITITPGELVVDYNAERTVMYVHCLDAYSSVKTLDPDQTERLKMFKRILGRD